MEIVILYKGTEIKEDLDDKHKRHIWAKSCFVYLRGENTQGKKDLTSALLLKVLGGIATKQINAGNPGHLTLPFWWYLSLKPYLIGLVLYINHVALGSYHVAW